MTKDILTDAGRHQNKTPPLQGTREHTAGRRSRGRWFPYSATTGTRVYCTPTPTSSATRARH